MTDREKEIKAIDMNGDAYVAIVALSYAVDGQQSENDTLTISPKAINGLAGDPTDSVWRYEFDSDVYDDLEDLFENITEWNLQTDSLQ